jgi:hypothetical protein
MIDYINLALTVAVVSVFVQFIKNSGFPYPRVAVISAAIGAGAAYYFIGNTAIWQAALQVLVYANAVYAFLIKPFET